jgi:hypothetical protein
MKIGWYTHHVTRDPKVAENGLQGDLGLFSGRFAGGAEMSDWEYLQQAPIGFDVTIVEPSTFTEHDPADFDSIVVTGTDAFQDSDLFRLSEYEPFVFVHHLQTPRDSLGALIAGARIFVTHTPAHMRREMSWAKPKRTGQVLSYFDTNHCQDLTDEPVALWAARNHPLKGKLAAEMWAAKNNLPFMALTDVPREEVLDAMARVEWFVHLPLAFESECRAVMEAVLSGCKIHTNNNVGITSVEDWEDADYLKHMIDKAGETFWRMVQL